MSENRLTFTDSDAQPDGVQRDASIRNRLNSIDQEGSITKSIGTGENAKNSFVYVTLKWSFLSMMTIILLIIAINVYFNDSNNKPDFVKDIKDVWSLATSLITLALGYAFGKSKE